MFGERTADGLEYGAKHIADLSAPPNAAELNRAFQYSSHWFEHEPEHGEHPREFTQEEYEQAQAAAEMAEESRRHALYQSYASYGSEHDPASYGAEETGDDYYQGGYATSQSEQHGDATMGAIGRREQLPKWAQSSPHETMKGGAPPSPPPRGPPSPQQPSPQQQTQQQAQQQTQQQPGSPVDRVPPGRLHQQQQGRSPRVPQSPHGGGSESERRRSAFSPQLFEKGSFAESKIRDVQRASSGDTPLSGRGSQRGSMGAYADFAARLHGAESNRSSRSARSYRG